MHSCKIWHKNLLTLSMLDQHVSSCIIIYLILLYKTHKISESILYAKSWDHSMRHLKCPKEKGCLRFLVPKISNNSHSTMTFSSKSCQLISSNQKLCQNNKLRLPHWKFFVIFPCQTYIAIGAIIQFLPNSPNMYTHCS